MKKFTLKPSEGKLTGLCAGLAEYTEIEVIYVRLIVIAVALMTGVIPGLLLYIVASLLTPKEGESNAKK